MNNVVPIQRRPGAVTRHDPARMKMFLAGPGKNLVGHEVDEAIEWCEIYQANPFVGDIYFFIFDADKPDKRRVVPVLGIGLYRKIAARTDCYRPDDEPPRFTYDESLVSKANPRGIVDCEVSVYKFSHGEWHRVTSRLRWDERAPIVERAEGYDYIDTGEVWPDSGKPKKKRVPKGEVEVMLDPSKPNWRNMPETMIGKCTEADVLRKAFPNEMSGSYVGEEMDAPNTIELTATEILKREDQAIREKRIGGPSIIIDWLDGGALQTVPVDEVHGKVMDYFKANEEDPSSVLVFWDRNKASFRQYWGMKGDECMDLKKHVEGFQERIKNGGADE